MNNLLKKLKANNIIVILANLESDGYAIIERRTIFVKETLSESKQIEVILHESKHILDHSEFLELYKIWGYHSKFEREADDYMVDSLIEENQNQYNYSMLLENYKIGIGYDTRYQRFVK